MGRRHRYIVIGPAFCLTALALVGAGCGAENAASDDLPTKLVGPAHDADDLFSLDRLPRFHLTLDDEAWSALVEEPKEYVSGTFAYGDTIEENVGVRLKGNLTLTPLDEKPAFKIKFNKWEKGRRFLGLEALTLQNMDSDASMLREHLSYLLFRSVGVPASRTGFAELVVNGEEYGVYLTLETLDDDFLAHNYADASGNLYEGDNGDDVDKDPVGWQQDEGADTSRDDLLALRSLATRDDLEVFFGDTTLDTERFLAFTATEHAVGHFDGYMARHNYFVYHELATDRWTFLPWSLDQTLARRTSPYEGEGYLTRKCLDADACLEQYIPVALDVVDTIESLDLQAEVDAVLELIDDASHADTHKRFSNEAMESAREGIRAWIDERPAELREALDCLEDGHHPDADGDGWGPCFADCDDDNYFIKPTAVEHCDGIDNDCSGFVDDDPGCECPAEVIDGRTYYFCTHGLTWGQARSFCSAQDHVLAHFDDRAQQDAVYAIAHATQGGKWSFGLADIATEGEYLWLDDGAPSYEAWAEGEPAHLLAWFDCVFFKGGDESTWVERNCIEEAPFVCSDPE